MARVSVAIVMGSMESPPPHENREGPTLLVFREP